MLVDLKGMVLEKFPRKYKDDSGKEYERMFVRLFQPGQRVNIDVNVKSDTYSRVEAGQEIQLEGVNVTAYNGNLYARQD